MKKIAQGIVRLRKLILTVAFLLLIPSAIGAIATRINYDILTYLPQDLDSMCGQFKDSIIHIFGICAVFISVKIFDKRKYPFLHNRIHSTCREITES